MTTCQKCGGEVQGWLCQGCGQAFREADAGVLVFDAAPPVDGWQPIETAPRDGTVFLARCGGFAPFECEWHGDRWVHMDPEDGPVAYKPDQWCPLNICRNCNGFGYLPQPPNNERTG